MVSSIEKAQKEFESIGGWRDADAKAEECRRKIDELNAKAEAERIAREKKAEAERLAAAKKKKTLRIVAIVVAAIAVVAVAVSIVVTKVIKYNDVVELEEAGQYAEAAIAYGKIENDPSAVMKSMNCWERVRLSWLDAETHLVLPLIDGTVETYLADENSALLNTSEWTDIVKIDAGYEYTLGLKNNGTLLLVGDRMASDYPIPKDWINVADFSAGIFHYAAIMLDGTVVAQGSDDEGQCNVEDWEDIKRISCGQSHTVGLKTDGTVVATGFNEYGQCNVEDWTDIVDISANHHYTVGLKSDGTVVATGDNEFGQCNVNEWKNITFIDAGYNHVIGITTEGTVVATGSNEYAQCELDEFNDIVVGAAGNFYTILIDKNDILHKKLEVNEVNKEN